MFFQKVKTLLVNTPIVKTLLETIRLYDSKTNKEDNMLSKIEDEKNIDILEYDFNKFKTRNIIFEKLEFLKQYIKMFSFTFPKEYDEFYEKILNQEKDYQNILEKYQNCIDNNRITFMIDPEEESERLACILNLELEIKRFVSEVVEYSLYKDKFSKLCCRVNIFYNALINTKRSNEEILAQLSNAQSSILKNITEVSTLDFFKNNSRKKEEILNYCIYLDYLLFKIFLRCGLVDSINTYKEKSKIYTLFIPKDYNELIVKFFIDGLDSIREFVIDNLKDDELYENILQQLQNLFNGFNDYETILSNSKVYDNVIKLENMVDSITKVYNIEFKLEISSLISIFDVPKETISVNLIAKNTFRQMESTTAMILFEAFRNFKEDISFEELFFVCEVFELTDSFLEALKETVFGYVCDIFQKYKKKYSKYSYNYINEKKLKVLNYDKTKKKEYVFFVNAPKDSLDLFCNELKRLNLDFKVIGVKIYLNSLYFKALKNLMYNFNN